MSRTLLYSLSRCWADVMAPSTDCLLTLLLILEAVPNSSPSIFCTRDTWCAVTHLLRAAAGAMIELVTA